MITKERLVELIYSCKSANISSSNVIPTIIKEAGVSSCTDIIDPIRRYKEKGSGLEKCVDEVYSILINGSSCSGCSGHCEDDSDPYLGTRFSNPVEAAKIIKYLKKDMGEHFNINKLEELGASYYGYENVTYEVSDLDYIMEDAVTAREDAIIQDARSMAYEEINEIMQEYTEPLKELSLVLGYEDIEEVDDVLILVR
jgi:hypothetical protein